MDEITPLTKTGSWKIELYYMPRREAHKVGLFWEDNCTVEEAYEVFNETFGGVPSYAVIEHASGLPEGEPMRYEVRLYGPTSSSAVAITTWQADVVEYCVRDYAERKVVKRVVILEVEVGEDESGNPSEWDWFDIIESGTFTVLDNGEEVVLD